MIMNDELLDQVQDVIFHSVKSNKIFLGKPLDEIDEFSRHLISHQIAQAVRDKTPARSIGIFQEWDEESLWLKVFIVDDEDRILSVQWLTRIDSKTVVEEYFPC